MSNWISLLMQDFYCPGFKSVVTLLHIMRIVMPRCIWGKKWRPDLFSLHILVVACCPAGITFRQLRKGNDWFDWIRHGADTAPGCCMLGRRAEQCSVTCSPNGLGCSNSFHPSLQPDRKARQSKNIRWNFIMPWQYIWLVWHWLNHLPFIFPWLCKSQKSRFSRLHFCRSQKQGASSWVQRSWNVTQRPWPLIVVVPSLNEIVSVITPQVVTRTWIQVSLYRRKIKGVRYSASTTRRNRILSFFFI